MYLRDQTLAWLTWTDGFRPHPYFGFIHGTAEEKLFEFKAAKRDPKEFNALFVGGSVAGAFVLYLKDSFSERLKAAVPRLKNKQIKMIDLTSGGVKEPQQFFEVSYLLEKVDLVVDISGYNEMSTGAFGSRFFPLDYPKFSVKYFSTKKGDWLDEKIAKLIKYVYVKLTTLPEEVTWLRRSHAYYTSWNSLKIVLYNAYQYFENRYLNSVKLKTIVSNPNEDSILLEQAQIWKKYTALTALVASSNGVKYFSFVQPNQYLPDSKIFSEEEKRIAITEDNLNALNRRMSVLKKAADEMGNAGHPVFNLMGIFANVREPVYIDNCCHLNELGNQIMANKIFSTIAKHW